MNEYIQKIKDLTQGMDSVKIMEVCGGHTNVVMKYGIREILPKNITLVSGPGCPVCVTAQKDIDNMVALANAGIPVAAYGDMMHVPGTKGSLDDAKTKGGDVALVYTAEEMLKPENMKRVFFGIGFETTTPMTAYLLEHGICVYSAHKIMPPPMKAITEDTQIDGFIGPGHVSCIVGMHLWEELNVPLVVSGFRKDQIIRAIYKLLELIKEGKNEVINDYGEVVKTEGNLKAQALIEKNMKLCDVEWRGLGIVPLSGYEPKDDALNAKVKYAHLLTNVSSREIPACRCGDILQGKAEPNDCKLFGTACTPQNPIGACMVSQTEGACGIAFKHLKNR